MARQSARPSVPPPEAEHPAIRALRDAPVDDEPLSEEERRGIEEGLEDARAGRVISTAELRRRLGI